MRPLFLALLISASIVSAQAEGNQSNAEKSAEAEALMRLQDVQNRLEAAGYKDIQLETDVLVVRARDKSSNEPVVLLVDPDTLANLPIEADPSTTGSGSSSDRR